MRYIYTVVIQIPKIELQKTGLPRGADPLFLFLLLLLLFFIVAIVRIAALVAIVAVF